MVRSAVRECLYAFIEKKNNKNNKTMEKKNLFVYQVAGACSEAQMKLFLSGSGMIGVLLYAVFVVYLKWNAIEQCVGQYQSPETPEHSCK